MRVHTPAVERVRIDQLFHRVSIFPWRTVGIVIAEALAVRILSFNKSMRLAIEFKMKCAVRVFVSSECLGAIKNTICFQIQYLSWRIASHCIWEDVALK